VRVRVLDVDSGDPFALVRSTFSSAASDGTGGTGGSDGGSGTGGGGSFESYVEAAKEVAGYM